MFSQSMVLSKQIPLRYDWLFGKKIDLLFFYGSILVGIICFCLMQSFEQKNSLLMMVLVANAFGAGPLHLGATAFPYLDKKNFHYFWDDPARRRIFFYAPPVIFALTVLGSLTVLPLVAFIFLVWTIQHLVQQNVGILLLYHRSDSGEAIPNRILEARSQQLAALFFSLVYFQRVLMNNSPFIIMDIIKAIALFAAFTAFAACFRSLYKQVKTGKYVNVPAFAFWIFSVFSLLPIAVLGKDYSSAFIITLSVHWFQYLTINTMLVKRKYAFSTDQLRGSAKPIILFISTCLMACFVVLGSSLLSTALTNKSTAGILLGALAAAFGLTHYFLDAFLWRFRDPFLRESVLVFLKKQTRDLPSTQNAST